MLSNDDYHVLPNNNINPTKGEKYGVMPILSLPNPLLPISIDAHGLGKRLTLH